jgi:alpha-glucoside transport system substrate-binding protein
LSTFAAKHGFAVDYEEYDDHAELVDRVEGDDPPDVIVPGFPAALFEFEDHLVDLSTLVNTKRLDKAFSEYLIDVATASDGAVLGAPISAGLKSLVWYKPDVFAANGYSAPETFDELVALSDAMVADGMVPWCNYIESSDETGDHTGWLGTDWIEDLLLGAEGPEVYDQWTYHDIPFTDERVETAFGRYQQMIDPLSGYVYDRANMLNEHFGFNAVPLGEQNCLMHRQATFFGVFIDMSGYDMDDFATFKFPSVDAAFSDAAFGGVGYHMAVLDDRKAVKKLAKFMLSRKFGETALAATGGWILPHTGFKHSFYPDEGMVRSWADITRAAIVADQYRYDASDMMPPEVGSGSFWQGIVDLVAGDRTVPQVLEDIEASWPTE